MFFDPLYVLYLIPGVAAPVWARWRVWSGLAAAAGVEPQGGGTGAEFAHRILQAGGAPGVGVGRIAEELSDWYDPRAKLVRLSPAVHDGRDLAAVAVAVREAGHALAHARYGAVWRLRTVPLVLSGLGAAVFWVVASAGALLGILPLFLAGFVVLTANVALQAVSLPFEAVAARLGREAVGRDGGLSPDELAALGRALTATGPAPVAAALFGRGRASRSRSVGQASACRPGSGDSAG